MTINELEEKIPFVRSMAYAQGKAIIIYKNDSCNHIKMSERLFEHLEKKLYNFCGPRVTGTKKEHNYKRKMIDSEKVKEMYSEGKFLKEIAETFCVAVSTVRTVVERLIDQGELERRSVPIPELQEYIIKNYKDVTAGEIANTFGISLRRVYDTKHRLQKKGLININKLAPIKEGKYNPKNIVEFKKYETNPIGRRSFKDVCSRNKVSFDDFEEIFSGEYKGNSKNKKYFYFYKGEVK